MPQVCFNEANFSFPSLEEADEEGLLLIGGKVTAERVIEAYKKGIFPWYNEDDCPMWWSPDPRFILFPQELHVSRSMRSLLKTNLFTYKMDTAFEEVIDQCASIARHNQDGTWITKEINAVYTNLFYAGYAHSIETWQGEKLVGGMYGLILGKVFFGESMFSLVSNASKFALITLLKNAVEYDISLLDCQVCTPHLQSLGARFVDRQTFLSMLKNLLPS